MLEDAYRGERATTAIQCVIGQKPRCIFDYRDEAFPNALEHILDRLVGQQTVQPYRYIHPLCPFLSVSEGRGADILAFFFPFFAPMLPFGEAQGQKKVCAKLRAEQIIVTERAFLTKQISANPRSDSRGRGIPEHFTEPLA